MVDFWKLLVQFQSDRKLQWAKNLDEFQRIHYKFLVILAWYIINRCHMYIIDMCIYIYTVYIFNITLVDLILLLLILYSYTAKSYQIKGQKTARWSGSWSFRTFTKRHRRGGGPRVVTFARGAVVGTTGGFTVVLVGWKIEAQNFGWNAMA